MRPQNPIENTGILLRLADQAFLGTCFFFRYPRNVLTAHHCVAGLKPDEIGVVFPSSRAGRRIFKVRTVEPHPTADVAGLCIEAPDDRDITSVLYSTWNDFAFGVDVMAFGYPAEWTTGQPQPTPRYFRGYIQRFFDHQSHLQYRYMAAELSFACPSGLSGSAIINPQLPGRMYGLVTENVRVTTEQESVLEVDDRGTHYKETFYRVINYGVCLWLSSVDTWLDQIIPPVPPEEMQRRAENQQKWNSEEAGRA